MRFLPTEITSLNRNDTRHSLLHDVQLCPAGHLLQRDRRLHFAGQIRVVESVSVADPFVWRQLKILSTERVALPGGAIGCT